MARSARGSEVFEMARILIVDDEKSIRFTLKAFLTKEGHEVDTAEDADVALDLLGRSLYDVVMSDIIMPRVSGVDLLKAIRSACPSVKVIMMTAAPSLETAKDSLLAGAFEYLYKPFSKEKAIEVVSRAVAEKKAAERKELQDEERERKEIQLSEALVKKSRALKTSEERYQALVEASPDGIAVMDGDLGLMFVNATALSLTGHQDEFDLMGESALSLVSPAFRDRMRADAAELDRNGGVITREYEMLRKDGGVFRAEARLTRLPAPSGDAEARDHVLLIFQDITQRHEAFLRLKLLSMALEQAFDGKVVTDLSGVILFANRAWARMHEWPEDDLVGRHLSEFLTKARYEEDMVPFLDALKNEGRTEALVRHATKSGLEFSTRMAAGTVEDEDGKPLAWVIAAHDLSREKKLQEQLGQAQKMEAVGTLASGIAHDFNNILCSIIGYAELVIPKLQSGSPVQGNVRSILNAGNRAKNLVQQILTTTRQTPQGASIIEIQPIVKEALKLLRAALPATIEIETNIQTRARIVADPTQIHQVVMNLCTNAYHAMKEKGGILSVNLVEANLSEERARAKHLEPGRYVVLMVSDTGTGIEKSVLERIFDPYFTTKKPDEGTGLGLAIVRGVVEGLDGRIEVESEPGRGTTFTLHFRAAKGEPAAAAPDARPAMPRGSESILFVDDEALIGALVRQALSSLGYRVQPETDPVKALKIFAERPGDYDLVITDMTMPHMAGDELTRKILAVRPNVPVIICTGYQDKVTPDDVVSMGARDLVFKPLDIHEFSVLIRKLLDET